jgi:gamma-glutamyltranspeptidase/glutathione hydrolase
MRRATLLFLLFLLLTITQPAQGRPTAGTRGMVATAHPLASRAGAEMLRAGGNAADAIAAAAFTLSVVEQHSSGIGGGGFAVLRMGERVLFFDFRETAPAAATRDMYIKDGVPDPIRSRDGILSVAVPGAVAGYLAIQERFGVLERAQVLAPAIAIAEKGFVVTERFRGFVEHRLALLRRDEEAARIFMVPGPNGGPPVPPPLGHLLVQEDLAATLRAIAKDGASAFYRGSIARLLAADMKKRGGLVPRDDLAEFRVRERQPLIGSYRGHAIATSPPPSSGGQILLTILNLMEKLPATTGWREPAALHLYIEASKRAFADRILLGDPDFVSYLAPLIPRLVAKQRADLLWRAIGPEASRAREVLPGQGIDLPEGIPPEALAPAAPRGSGPNTAHLCVIDAAGNAVSMTTTVNYGWGSGVVARGTGVVWNDEMDDFAVAVGVPNAYEIVGSEANAVAPGKVPLSSMTPTLLFAGPDIDSPVRLVIGSPGGSRIPTTVAQATMHHLDHGADIQRALSIGRVHHQHLPDIVRVEAFGLEPATVDALARLGHVIEIQTNWSNATAIAVDPATGVRTGAADPRGIGNAVAQ